MERLHKKLFALQELGTQAVYLSGLLYILREALRADEDKDVLDKHFVMASAFISNYMMELEENLLALTDELIVSVGKVMKKEKAENTSA